MEAMRLREGDAAPDFLVLDSRGRPLTLGTRGRVLLTFYGGTDCAASRRHLRRLLRHHSRLREAGIRLVGFWQNPRRRVQEDLGPLPFAAVPDPGLRIYALYGVERTPWGRLEGALGFGAEAVRRGDIPPRPRRPDALLPAEFLIEEGMLRRAHYGRGFLSPLEIERATHDATF